MYEIYTENGLETIFTHKLLVNFTKKYRAMASYTEFKGKI